MNRQDKKNLKAQERMKVFMKVQAGIITAARGAQELGISRQAYYEWETRGMEALMSGMSDRPTGRPRTEPPTVVKKLEKKVDRLEEELFLQKKMNEINKLQQEAKEGDDESSPFLSKKERLKMYIEMIQKRQANLKEELSQESSGLEEGFDLDSEKFVNSLNSPTKSSSDGEID